MPKNDIGGFFVSLGLNADKNSFESGNKLVDGVANSFNKLIGAARNAAVVLAGTAVATGAVESAAYKTAEKIGISTEALDLWKASAKIAGVNANGLISAMGKFASVMGRMRIDGAGLDQFTKKLGELGLVTDKVDIKKMLDMAPDELMTEIIRKAQEASAKTKKEIADANNLLAKNPKDEKARERLKGAQKERQRISIIVGDILGEAGQDFFIELERQGKTIDEFKEGAGRTVFTTAADNQKGANFAVEFNTLKAEIESASKLLGDAIGDELTKYVKELNQWIQENGPLIRDTIYKIAEFTGKAVKETFNAVQAGKLVYSGAEAARDVINAKTPEEKEKARKKLNETLEEMKNMENEGGVKSLLGKYVNFVSDTYDSVMYGPQKSIEEQSKKKQQEIYLKKLYEYVNKDKGFFSRNEKIDPNKLTPDGFPYITPEEVQYYRESLGDKIVGKYIKINDGIMRPDGTVTQVAPDDWVFAARNVGDLARAFIPQSLVPAQSASPSSYTINQTFNISGSNDIPQVLKEQAYRGTQDGLLQLMSQSSQRLQLMSGTR